MTSAEPGEPEPPLDYSRLYDFRFQGIDQRARQEVWAEIAAFVWERMRRPRRVLDPAGGRGEFVNAVPADEVWLVDVVDYGERQTDPRVRIVIGNVLDVDLPDAYFDGVFASNLLEHFRTPEEVAAFLTRMRTALATGGVLALMGPNFKYCARDYFDCADHLLALTHVSVQEHLYATGFAVTEVIPRFLPFSFRSRLPASRRLTRAYLRTPAMTTLISDCDHFVAGAAMIGGISYFHTYAYDLLATNERIIASSCDAAISAFRSGRLQKVTYLSSSMVFESSPSWPSYEGQEREVPPPRSSYGFQKLAVEYFAHAAWDQYGVPYTIVRPFNCVGVGEGRALGEVEVLSGNVKLAMSHVVPDLVQKVVKGQDPLRILGDGTQVRHYTYGGDLAHGIATAIEHPDARNDDFNLSTGESTTVLELAELIWKKLKGADVPFRWVSDPPFEHDVARRVPSTEKAKRILGFEATTSLSDMLDEVIPWVAAAVADGRI